MGRGSSGLKAGGGGGGTKPSTPSGITYQQFMAMDDDQKFKVVQDIIADSSIVM